MNLERHNFRCTLLHNFRSTTSYRALNLKLQLRYWTYKTQRETLYISGTNISPSWLTSPRQRFCCYVKSIVALNFLKPNTETLVDFLYLIRLVVYFSSIFYLFLIWHKHHKTYESSGYFEGLNVHVLVHVQPILNNHWLICVCWTRFTGTSMRIVPQYKLSLSKFLPTVLSVTKQDICSITT